MFVTCWKLNLLSNILLWVLSVCKTPIISKVWWGRRLGDDARISSGHCGLRWGIIGQNSPCFYLPLYIVFVEIHLHRYIWWNANTQLQHIAMWSQKVHYWPEWPLPYLPVSLHNWLLQNHITSITSKDDQHTILYNRYLQYRLLQNHIRGIRYKDGQHTVGRFRDIRPACEEPRFLTFISILHA